MHRLIAAITCALLSLWPTCVRAELVYDFSYSYRYVSEFSTYNVAAGPLTVNIYLQEVLINPNSLIALDGGLYAFGVKIDRLAGDTGASIQTINSNAAALWTAKVDSATTISATTASFGAVSDSDLGIATNVNPDANGRIFLGSISLIAESGTTHFTFSKYPPKTLGGQTVTAGASAASLDAGSAYDLDFDNNSAFGSDPFAAYKGTSSNLTGFDITVSAVPEPSSILLVGIAAVGAVANRWRIKRARTQQTRSVKPC